MKDVPRITLVDGETIVDCLVNHQICSSKREAREMVGAGAISFNHQKIMDETYVISRECAIDKKVIVIKKGKKNLYLGIFESLS